MPLIGTTPQTRLEPYQQKILARIQKKGLINGREYSTPTDRAKSTHALDFQKLIELGLIERKGKAKATYYVMKDSK